jgi:hypothetical protein
LSSTIAGCFGAGGDVQTLPSHSGVRPAWPQRIERIDDKRKPLEIDLNSFDRLRGGHFVHRGHRQNRLAHIDRLLRQPSLCVLVRLDHRAVVGEAVARGGNFVGSKDSSDAGHRQGLAGVDPDYPRVRHRAQQQLAEQHAVGAIVLGVFRLSGNFRVEIGSGIVLADQLVWPTPYSRTALPS